MPCTRERKERFIRTYSRKVGSVRLHMLTDDAIDDIVSDLIATERLRNRINRENRRIWVRGASLSPDRAVA